MSERRIPESETEIAILDIDGDRLGLVDVGAELIASLRIGGQRSEMRLSEHEARQIHRWIGAWIEEREDQAVEDNRG